MIMIFDVPTIRGHFTYRYLRPSAEFIWAYVSPSGKMLHRTFVDIAIIIRLGTLWTEYAE